MIPSISFSLTEKVVIDPILTLRAPLSPLESGRTVSWKAKVWQGIQSEVIARVVAVFISVFAAVDTLIHFETGIYKGVCLLAGISYNKSAVYAHFQQTIWFAELTVLGSIVGVVWPGVFKHCRYSPPAPPNKPIEIPPISIQELITVVDEKKSGFLEQLKQFWEKSKLYEKHWFVQVFNQDRFKDVRTELASIVYRPLQKSTVEWLTDKEVSAQGYAFFFHATSIPALKSILKSKKVEVRNKTEFLGAFVSTQPEIMYGNCILAFKRNIERLSHLNRGFQVNEYSYWAGFSQDIPVTASTLAYIILNEENIIRYQDLANCCQQWANRRIEVISLPDARRKLASVLERNMGIPIEWPNENHATGKKIMDILTPRVGIPIQISIREKTKEYSKGKRERSLNAIA